MGFLASLDIVGSALSAERFRIDIISQNVTNMETTRTANGEPYRRKQVVLQERPITFKETLNKAQHELVSGGVEAVQVVDSDRDFVPVYNPTHPDANEEGYVMYPNVNRSEEQLDLMAATNAYSANLTALELIKAMAARTLEIGK